MGLEKKQSQETCQTTSKTLLITTQVAVAAISLWSIYGSTIRLKISQVTAAVSGNAANYEQSTHISNDLQRVGQIRASQKDVTTSGPDADELRSSFE